MAMLEKPIKGIKEVKNYIIGNGRFERKDCGCRQSRPRKVDGEMSHLAPKEEDQCAVRRRKQPSRLEKDDPSCQDKDSLPMKDLLEENFEEVSRIQTMEHGK